MPICFFWTQNDRMARHPDCAKEIFAVVNPFFVGGIGNKPASEYQRVSAKGAEDSHCHAAHIMIFFMAGKPCINSESLLKKMA